MKPIAAIKSSLLKGGLKGFFASEALQARLQALMLSLSLGAQALMHIIFPPRSWPTPFEARGLISGTSGFSPELFSKLRFLDSGACLGCARPFDPSAYLGAKGLCQTCIEKPLSLEAIRAAVVYDQISREVILRFKHGDRLDLAPSLSLWLSRTGADILPLAEVIIPVPLHPLKLWQRRYNQAAELARPLAKRLNIPYDPLALKRIRYTQSQGQSKESRFDNLKGAFKVPQAKQKVIKDRTIVLIDDVLTSGASLEHCARALKQAGAKAVYGLVLARAAPHHEALTIETKAQDQLWGL